MYCNSPKLIQYDSYLQFMYKVSSSSFFLILEPKHVWKKFTKHPPGKQKRDQDKQETNNNTELMVSHVACRPGEIGHVVQGMVFQSLSGPYYEGEIAEPKWMQAFATGIGLHTSAAKIPDKPADYYMRNPKSILATSR
eukprot:3713928-Amphidinium_carterae.1